MSDEDSINLAPPLGTSVGLGVMLVAFEAVVLVPPIGFWKGVCALAVGVAVIFVWSAVFFRGSWIYGIELREDGFVFRAPFRRPRFIGWSSITEVLASAIIDGNGESATTLRIRSTAGKAWIYPNLATFGRFVDKLSTLEGFDSAAWSAVDVCENEAIRHVVPKRTVVFRRPTSAAAV